jgi:RNA polymerase sigma factor (sigma-70 family)
MKVFEQSLEDELVRRLYAREEPAMALFYSKYHKALYHTIWRIVRQDELAEDILQETMLKFWLTFPSYDTSKGRLFTWALTIARNLAIDRLRSARRTTERTHSLTDAETLHLAAPTG